MIVFLDTGLLGLVSSPNNKGEAKQCNDRTSFSSNASALQHYKRLRVFALSSKGTRYKERDKRSLTYKKGVSRSLHNFPT